MRRTRIAAAPAVAAFLLTFTHALAAQQRDTLRFSLDDAVQRALARNEQIRVASGVLDQARGALISAEADALPKLDFSYNYARNVQRPVIFFNQGGQVQQISIGSANDNTFGLMLKQTIFDAGLASATYAAKLARQYADQSLDATKQQVALGAKVAYYQVLLDSALVGVREAAIQQAQRRLDQVRQRATAGLASEYDSLTARVAVENLRPPLIAARSALRQDRDQLKRFLGLSLDTPVTLTDSLRYTPYERPTPHEIAQHVAQRPDLEAQQRMVQLRQAALSAERGKAWPTLSLNLGLQRHASSASLIPTQSDFSQSFQVGLSFGWSLFDGRANEGRVLADRGLLEQERARLDGKQADVALEVQQVSDALDAAQAQVEAAQGNLDAAHRALEIAQSRFANGLSTQVELGDAELADTQARTNYAQALFQYNVGLARWAAALGEY